MKEQMIKIGENGEIICNIFHGHDRLVQLTADILLGTNPISIPTL